MNARTMKMINHSRLIELFIILFSGITLSAMDVIEAKIIVLKDEREQINKALVKRYGDSTMTYRMLSKYAFSEINEKIKKLENEKMKSSKL